MKSQIAQTSRGPVEYTMLGSGPVVLACHGTSANCFSTGGYAPLVDAGLSLLTPSRPGYGRTPLSVGRTAAEAAEVLAALLDYLGVRTCTVMAISGGGPTGVALAANHQERVTRLALVAAVTRPEERPNEPAYRSQAAFYGPMHSLLWRTLGLVSNLSPRRMARQTMAIFSTHNTDDALRQLSPEDIQTIRHFYQGHSSRHGALNDGTHTVGKELLEAVCQPTLVVHSREDGAVPFNHAEWSLEHIPNAVLVESGCTGHFYWVGPDYQRVSQRLIAFLNDLPPGSYSPADPES